MQTRYTLIPLCVYTLPPDLYAKIDIKMKFPNKAAELVIYQDEAQGIWLDVYRRVQCISLI